MPKVLTQRSIAVFIKSIQPTGRHKLPLRLGRLASTFTSMASRGEPFRTSGATDPVWVHEDPYNHRPHFGTLEDNIETDVCVIGAGIAGISTCYELVQRGKDVTLIEARGILSGETGRTSGHLSYSLDASYMDITTKHGEEGAQIAAESNLWAIRRVGEISKDRNINCNYRVVPNYEISQYQKGEQGYDQEMEELRKEAEKCASLGLPVSFDPEVAIEGWNGKPDQRGAAIHREQAAFHPTKYVNGLVRWLANQNNFRCFTGTRMHRVDENPILSALTSRSNATVTTEAGHQIRCDNVVEATCIPLQKLAIVVQLEWFRTYCIAIRIPRGSVEDCLINDQADPYIYVRQTDADGEDNYLIVGGQDHKVAQSDDSLERYRFLERWTRARFPQSKNVDYCWSGQVLNSSDMVSFIGQNQGRKHIYVATGDTGHGLTQGVIASRLIADEIDGISNRWLSLYNPSRIPPLSTIPSTLKHDIQVNSQYTKLAQSELRDIEDLAPGTGGILNRLSHGPIAVYKDRDGQVQKFSAICPHLGGRLCWNSGEQSFDCPVHGSRFSNEGICIMGPAERNLKMFSNDS